MEVLYDQHDGTDDFCASENIAVVNGDKSAGPTLLCKTTTYRVRLVDPVCSLCRHIVLNKTLC